jgi:hypothetical protein
MQAALGSRFAFGFGPLADIGEVFEHQSAPWFATLDELFGQDMVTIAPESGLRMSEVAQVALRAFGPTLLQRAFETEVAAFGGLPRFLAQELIGRSHGGLGQP